MARVNIYLPDELANEAKEAGINISGIAQEAIRARLGGLHTNAWLEGLKDLPKIDISAEDVHKAITEAKEELWRS